MVRPSSGVGGGTIGAMTQRCPEESSILRASRPELTPSGRLARASCADHDTLLAYNDRSNTGVGTISTARQTDRTIRSSVYRPL